MKTPNLHVPNVGGPTTEDHAEHPHRKSALQRAKQVEGLINKLMIGLVVLLAIALVYGLTQTSGAPAYFH